MNEIRSYNHNEAQSHFANSDNWRLFCLKFAECFYGLKPEQQDYPAWFNLAMECNNRMNVLLQALDQVEETRVNGEKVTVKQVRRAFDKIHNQTRHQELKLVNCPICNNTREVFNAEARIEGKIKLLNPQSPEPCHAYATSAPCVCVGGEQIHTDNRFMPPVENGQTIYGCEHIAQRNFVDECNYLLRTGGNK